jgi:ParB-like nuclease domain
MANRRDKLNQSNAFARIPSAHEMTNSMSPGDAPQIELVNIFEIWPDRQQPRRAMPMSLARSWGGDTDRIKEKLFDPWLRAYAQETGLTDNEIADKLKLIITGKAPDPDESQQRGIIENGLFKIVELAASINQKQLINPITVYPDRDNPDRYRIETGERRWLAYHLLHLFQPAVWDHIPAQIVESPDIWKQAYENNSRDDLNAIGKARQYALLLMDLLKENGRTFKPIDSFIDDLPFYAQVKDDRVPDKKGQVLLHGMGISSRGALSEYRSFLKLPPLVWQLGDEYNWSRERLYELSKLPPEDAIDHARILRRVDDQSTQDVLSQSIPPKDVLSQNISKSGKSPRRHTEGYLGLDTKAFRADATRIARILASGRQLSAQKSIQVLNEINNLRQWLDDAEHIVRVVSGHDE